MSKLAVRSGAKKRRLFAIDDDTKENGLAAAKKQVSSTTNSVTEPTKTVAFDDDDAYANHFGEPEKERLVKLAEDAKQASPWTRSEPEQSPLGTVTHFHLSSTSGIDLKRMWSSVPSSLRLRRRFEKLSSTKRAEFIERSLLAVASHYHDLLISNRTVENATSIRDAYAVHAMCHVLRGRDRVMKNNAKLATAAANKEEIETPRDQGFTRPKVLIIVPFRNAAFEVIQRLIKFSGSEQQENKHRFEGEYGISDENEKINMSKPKDYLEYFKGNTNDMFCLGMKLTRKTLKLYSATMSSDIIVASPLGLRMAIGDEGESTYDYDFLSSIEVLIIDQCEAILMQNWNHIEYIWQHLNKIPQQPRGTDFSRIKEWYLDGLAPYVRQNIILSPFLTPEINHLFTKDMKNVQGGKIKTMSSNSDMITSASISLRQVFYRFDSSNAAADPEARFQTFVKKILPNLTSSTATQGHVLMFISTYHDFVRVRNHFDEQNISFDSCNDYSTGKDLTRARARFFSGESKYLLYTQRLHFYRRPNIRGTQAVVFYGLPDNPEFYLEMLQGVKGTADKPSQCTAMFSKYDRLKLERIVGDVRAARMCESAVDNVYVFE